MLPCDDELALAHTAAAVRRRRGTVAEAHDRRQGPPCHDAPLVVEAFITTLAVMGIVWAAWIALWLIEQRW